MSCTSLSRRMALAIDGIHKAFGAPGDHGYETPQGKALFELYQLGFALAHAPKPTDADPLEDRLADCLAECIDTTLLTVRDTAGDWPVELRLGSFNQEIAERAAGLLEEIGK